MSIPQMGQIGAYIEPVAGNEPAADSAAGGARTSGVIDRYDYGDSESCVLVGQTGALAGTCDSLTVAVKLQHCGTAAGIFSDLAGAVVTLTDESKFGQLDINLGPAKRYLQIVETPAFVNPGADTAVPSVLAASWVVLGGAYQLPE